MPLPEEARPNFPDLADILKMDVLMLIHQVIITLGLRLQVCRSRGI